LKAGLLRPSVEGLAMIEVLARARERGGFNVMFDLTLLEHPDRQGYVKMVS